MLLDGLVLPHTLNSVHWHKTDSRICIDVESMPYFFITKQQNILLKPISVLESSMSVSSNSIAQFAQN